MSIIQIDDLLISSEIFTEFFACDYEKCKGCCCIIGDSGAPIEEEEKEALQTEYDGYKYLLTPPQRAVIEKEGFYYQDEDGDFVTNLMGSREECVYTGMEKDGYCYCVIERAFLADRSCFRKPISCWIYPIRVSKLSSGMTSLNFHRWHICQDAFERGKRESIRVYEFLKEPIIVAFGEDIYEAMEELGQQIRSGEISLEE